VNEILNKLSSYNVFNYLLPGIVFSVIASEFIQWPFTQRNIIVELFLYYFVGLVISRFGSVVIDPIIKGIGLVRFENYKDYILAEKKDAKIEVLSEVNNTYRTFCSLLVLLLLLKGYLKVETRWPSIKPWNGTLLVVLLLILFSFSYRKQSNYISQRVKAAKE
jgi:hypothetical protein